MNAQSKFICQTTGWLANQMRQVKLFKTELHYQLCVEDIGQFFITQNGSEIDCHVADSTTEAGLLQEVVLGPCLVLAFALRQRWCLHASAATCFGKTIAFIGESGNGKSTLAHYLGKQSHLGWRRVTDDVLPVELTPTGIVALPHFPQLKFPYSQQPWRGVAARLPLSAIYVIADQHAQPTEISCAPLNQSLATLALVRHTVAARLFDPDLLRQHLDFCATAITHIPIYRLSYPHDYTLLPEVCDLLTHTKT